MRYALLVCAACDVAAPAPDAPTRAVYTVAPGDTLGAIAHRFGTTARALARDNGLRDANLVRADQRIVVPATDAPDLIPLPDLPPPAPERACAVDHSPSVDGCAVDGDRVVCLDFASDLPVTPPFEIDRVDLDGDGHDETIVAALVDEHGTLDPARWRLSIGDTVGAPAVELEVDEWGDGSLVDDGRGGCDLLATRWDDADDPLRGPGLYLVARRMRYRDGALVPVDAPMIARRYTDAFADERREVDDDADLGAPRPVGDWLQEGELRVDEPARTGEVTGLDRGTVIAARRVSGDDGDDLALDVRRADGVVVTLDPFAYAESDDWELPPHTFVPRAYGWLGAGVTQPPGWIPRALDSLVGRDVTLEWRTDLDDDGESPIVWLASE